MIRFSHGLRWSQLKEEEEEDVSKDAGFLGFWLLMAGGIWAYVCTEILKAVLR